jgi:hypothetical protein
MGPRTRTKTRKIVVGDLAANEALCRVRRSAARADTQRLRMLAEAMGGQWKSAELAPPQLKSQFQVLCELADVFPGPRSRV